MIAILGSGSIAHSHANAIRHCGKELTLVVNPHIEAAKQFAAEWNIPNYSGNSEALYAPEITHVHVCTPAALHYEQVKSLLEHGKHVLCEKPLCLSYDEAKELADLAKKKGLRAAVDLNVRYNPACMAAQEKISSASFGEVVLSHGVYLQEFEILPTAYTWRYQEETAGKMRSVTEIGTHLIDLLYFFTGLKMTRVSASFNKLHKERVLKDGMMYPAGTPGEDAIVIDSEDSALIQYQLENGRYGSFVLSEVSAGHLNTIELSVAGSKQSLSWNSDEATKLSFAEKGQPTSVLRFAFGNNGFNDSICELVKDFYEETSAGDGECIGRNVLPSFEDGAYLAAVCQAIYESANRDAAWMKVL